MNPTLFTSHAALVARLTDSAPALVSPPTFYQSLDQVVLRVVCAWCSTVQTEGSVNAPTSHGMCANCSATLEAEMDATDAQRAA